MLLSACSTKEFPDTDANDTEIEVNSDSDAGDNSNSDDGSEENGDESGIKTLTDTDTPDKANKLTLTYDSYDKLGLEYAEGAMGALYDGDINTRLSYYAPKVSTTYNVARLDRERQIRYIKLFCSTNYERNVGVELQLSVDGIDYITVHTLTSEDTDVMKDMPLIIEVNDLVRYRYFRIYHEESEMGYDLNEVELYEEANPRVYERVVATYHDFGDGKGGQDLSAVYGTESTKGTLDGIKLMWDGVTDTTYCNYSPSNTGSWSSAKLAEPTVLGKFILSTIWQPANNIGTSIQASVDGTEWTTLYTLSTVDGSFVEGVGEWKLETLEVIVEDTTAYNYVRVYDGAGKGYCFAEVEVYKLVSSSANVPSVDTGKYPLTTVNLNNSVSGVQILGERNLASDNCINCDWSCSGIEITLECTGSVTFAVSSDKACYFRVYVDGIAKYNGSTLYYTVNGDTNVTLKNLSEGEHTIRLIKVTGWTIATAEIKSVTFNGTMSETAPAGNDYYIEFVGDSITCAWGTIGPGGGSYEGQDGTLAFSYLIANEQNADYSMTALSGQGLLCGEPNVTVGYEYASWKKDKVNKYDFARQADMVVINIGTNDFYQKDDLNIDADDFKAAYKSFLEMVKVKNGEDCKIICVYNCMNDNFGDVISTLCREMGGADAGYYSYKLDRAKSHTNGSGHPTAAEEAAYANYLNPIITAIRNGTYDPSDYIQYERVTATYENYADRDGQKNAANIGGGDGVKGVQDGVKVIFDGKADNNYAALWAGGSQPGSWVSASLAEATVIGKLELTTNWQPAINIGTAIQGSVDGSTWVDLYVLSANDGDFVVGQNAWGAKSMEVVINDTTAYNYIRAYDKTGNGLCFSEIAVYTATTS